MLSEVDMPDASDLVRASGSPLAIAAAPVLACAARLGRQAEGLDVVTPHETALGVLRRFSQAAKALALTDDGLAVSQGALASLLADTILESPGTAGGDTDIAAVVHAIEPVLVGESLHEAVERMLASPSANRAVLDLVYTCLSLGLSGRSWRLADMTTRHAALREKLWRALRSEDVPAALSPEWRGLDVPPPARGVPAWIDRLLGRGQARQDAELIDGLVNNPRHGDDEIERAIRQRFADALAIIGPTLRRKGQSLTRLPWYAVIGPPGVGKTTALRNSGLDFPLVGQSGFDPLQGSLGTRHCDFWLTGQAMFLDTAGRFVVHDGDAGRDRQEWRAFLALLGRTRRRAPLNGIVMTIGVPELVYLKADERRRMADALRSRIVELQDGLGVSLPTYVVLTKLDLVAGFVEFFDALDRQEREQALGFSLPIEPGRDLLARFDRLVERQRASIVDRLWHERDIQRRARILEFPAQFAALGPALDDLLGRVFDDAGLAIALSPRGVYFTSATQQGVPIDRWSQPMAAMTRLSMRSPAAHTGPGRGFFLRTLYRDVILGEAGLVARRPARGDA